MKENDYLQTADEHTRASDRLFLEFAIKKCSLTLSRDEILSETERLLKAMARVLSKREYTVICLRYGLKGGRCYAQREVACFLKISRSYISRIEKKAIEKLRAALKKEDFL